MQRTFILDTAKKIKNHGIHLFLRLVFVSVYDVYKVCFKYFFIYYYSLFLEARLAVNY